MTTAVVHRQPTLLDAYTAVSDPLEAAGIRVTADFANAHPPCVYITPPELTYRFHKGDFSASYRVTVIAPLTDRLRAIAQLSELLTRVIEALHFAPATATAVDVINADGSPALPGYELAWQATIGRKLV